MDIRKRVGANIRRLREEKGLSQEDLGVDAHSGRTYVSELERGKRNATVTVVEKFAKVLGVTPGYLLDADLRRKS